MKKRLTKQLVALITSSTLLACAGTKEVTDDAAADAPKRGSDCIFRSSIRGYSVLDEANIIVEASGRRNYHVALRRRAYGLKSSWGISFESPTGRVCAGFSEVTFNGQGRADHVRITSIRALTPEDHEDLLIQYGKKEPEIEQTSVPQEVAGAEVEELDPGVTDDSSDN